MGISKELTKDGEYYSDRYTCPKCKHWERNNFQYKNGKLPLIEREVMLNETQSEEKKMQTMWQDKNINQPRFLL